MIKNPIEHQHDRKIMGPLLQIMNDTYIITILFYGPKISKSQQHLPLVGRRPVVGRKDLHQDGHHGTTCGLV